MRGIGDGERWRCARLFESLKEARKAHPTPIPLSPIPCFLFFSHTSLPQTSLPGSNTSGRERHRKARYPIRRATTDLPSTNLRKSAMGRPGRAPCRESLAPPQTPVAPGFQRHPCRARGGRKKSESRSGDGGWGLGGREWMRFAHFFITRTARSATVPHPPSPIPHPLLFKRSRSPRIHQLHRSDSLSSDHRPDPGQGHFEFYGLRALAARKGRSARLAALPPLLPLSLAPPARGRMVRQIELDQL